MVCAIVILLQQAILVGKQPDLPKLGKALMAKKVNELKGSASSNVRWINRTEKPAEALTFKSLKSKIQFAERLAAESKLGQTFLTEASKDRSQTILSTYEMISGVKSPSRLQALTFNEKGLAVEYTLFWKRQYIAPARKLDAKELGKIGKAVVAQPITYEGFQWIEREANIFHTRDRSDRAAYRAEREREGPKWELAYVVLGRKRHIYLDATNGKVWINMQPPAMK